ncbi:translation elongation factor EF-1 subunit alpha [Candidatus Woesearchaeota archaeon]|nr:translation elongation factor EF-1 subunit alpha [Candidatus Woesearchaeota archaeon]
MADKKEHMNLVFIGHVDHGKSTTVGRLLYDSGTIDDNTMRKLKEEAAANGKAGFEFAYTMDNLKEERERGVTIDLAHKKYQSKSKDFTIIDAPGHKDFIKNMITGASQADAAVLVVAANDGINAQTKEHVFLSKTLGINQIIIAVNKMDISGVDYSEAKFNEVKADVGKLLASVGFKPATVPFIPTASLLGGNIVNKSDKMPWYTGPVLAEAIDALVVPEKPVDKPLRMPIQDVYSISGIGVVPVGKIETGVMKVNQKVIAVPGREGKGVPGEVKSIEMHHEQFQEAIPGDNVGISVRGFGKKDVARGDVIGTPDNIPKVAEEFTAKIVVLNHPSVITVGYCPVFHIHTAQVAGQIVEIIDKTTAGEVTQKPDFIKNGDSATVRIRPVQPLVIEKNTEIPELSRFALRDSGVTVAAGMCVDMKEKPMG